MCVSVNLDTCSTERTGFFFRGLEVKKKTETKICYVRATALEISEGAFIFFIVTPFIMANHQTKSLKRNNFAYDLRITNKSIN